jgi:uncharacterized RDD family membrane protein YckC
MEINAIKYAGFWRRLWASLIDDLLLTGICLLFFLPFKPVLSWFLESMALNSEGNGWWVEQLVTFVLMAAVSAPYYINLQSQWGTTPGKWCLGVWVVDEVSLERMSKKQASKRFFTYFLSILPFGAGFLMVLFHPRKQALHDIISHTLSVRSRSFPFRKY